VVGRPPLSAQQQCATECSTKNNSNEHTHSHTYTHTHPFTRVASPCSHEQLQLRGRGGGDCFILVLLCLEWEINMEGRGGG
jgi:hypothetical protein